MNRPAKQREEEGGHASKDVLNGVSKPYTPCMITTKVPGSGKASNVSECMWEVSRLAVEDNANCTEDGSRPNENPEECVT